jgi:hypothetical protein
LVSQRKHFVSASPTSRDALDKQGANDAHASGKNGRNETLHAVSLWAEHRQQ